MDEDHPLTPPSKAAHARSPTGNSATRDHKRRSIFTSSSTTADAVQVAIKPEKDPPKFSCTLCPATSTTRGPFTITDNLRVLIALILGECPAGLASDEAKVCQACRWRFGATSRHAFAAIP